MTPVVKKPVLPLAWLALLAATAAAALALYGSFLSETHLAGSPLNVARNQPGHPSLQSGSPNRIGVQFAAYVLPFGLGLGAAVAGGRAMRAIELSGTHSGNRQAVFAIMIGGLSAVLSGCMLFAVHGWQYVPALYGN